MRRPTRATTPDPETAVQPETPTVALDLIHDHPANPRINAVADDELVDSVRAQGVLDPLMVAPRGDGEWNLLDGHRRKDAAIRAGLTSVRVNPRYDLVTEAQQIEVMVITGLQKALLSPVEEAAGYEQLELLGMDEAAIAAATGFSVRRVKDRLRLNQLPDEARSKVHAGDATLVDLAALEEFDADEGAIAQLVDALGTPNFRTLVHTLRGARDRVARHRERISEFEDAGAKPWTPDDGRAALWSRDAVCPLTWFRVDDLRAPVGHDGCLGYYYAGPLSYADPVLVCTDAAGHDDPVPVDAEAEAARAARDAQFERDRADREARAARRAGASAARVEWLVGHYTAMLPVKSHGGLAAAAKVLLPLVLTDTDEVGDDNALVVALDLHPADRGYAAIQQARAEAADEVATAKPTRVLAVFAGVLAAMTAERLDTEPSFLDDATDARRVLDLWDWMKTAGYPLSDADKEVRAELEVRYTELTADADDAEAP